MICSKSCRMKLSTTDKWQRSTNGATPWYTPQRLALERSQLGSPLFAVNRAIGKALVRVILPPETETRYVALKHTCNDDDCTIVCCFCGRDHYSCYNCEIEKQELNP